VRFSEAAELAAAQKDREENRLAAHEACFSGQSSCRLRIMCIVSVPAMRVRAQRKHWNPTCGAGSAGSSGKVA